MGRGEYLPRLTEARQTGWRRCADCSESHSDAIIRLAKEGQG
jgi:hypothetical protein